MGAEDIRRQKPNVERMELLGATVAPGDAGARTLKEAVSEAIRDWVSNVGDTHYIIGSAVGPAPYPAIVRDLQRVIGDEARAQILEREGRLPDRVVACVGGGSNAIGMFAGFQHDDGRRADRRRGRGGGARLGSPRRAAHGRRTSRRAARLAQPDHAGRRGPDHRGALGLRRARLPGLRARARVAQGVGPSVLRGRGRPRRAARLPDRGAARGHHPRARTQPRPALRPARTVGLDDGPRVPVRARGQGPRRGDRPAQGARGRRRAATQSGGAA